MASFEFPIVNVENGPVRGLKTRNIFGSEHYSFRGIPYMKPPLGKLRFREAESSDNWIVPFDATQEGPSYCMTDFMTGLQDGQENSGTINIYTKIVEPKELFPVMIWAGGSCVNFLTITPQTEGLFQKAIIMSGSAFNRTWSFTHRNKQAQRLTKILGWKGNSQNEKEILEFLESVPAFELDNASKELMSVVEQHGFGILVPFAPVVESYWTKNCIISKEPIELAREAWSNSIDIIVMGTSFEGLLRAFVEEGKAYALLENPSYFAPLNDLNMGPNDTEAIKFGERIRDLYYGNGSQPSIENQEQYLTFCSDFHFWYGLHRLVRSRTKYSSARTYLLRFDVDAELNMFKAMKKAQKYRGACHADDLFYLSTTNYHAPPPPNSRGFITIQRLVEIFTSFAITGNPNCDEVSNLKINPCGETISMKCVNITENNVTEIELPELNRLKIWDSVYDEHQVPMY